MKKLLPALLFICSVTLASGQTNVYHPFPDSNAVWRHGWGELCSLNPPPVQCSSDYQYRLSGDTIIASVWYARVYKEGIWRTCGFINNTWQCNAPAFGSSYHGAVRNDVPNKKVYFIPSTQTTEELLYDFDLQVGDTIIGQLNRCNNKVQSIDSVLVGSSYRKRFNLQYNNGEGVWIEGVGSTGNTGSYSGTFEEGCGAPCVCMFSWTFGCFIENGNFMYGNTMNCSIITSTGNEFQEERRIKIFPNPAAGIFTIESSEKISAVELTTVLGKRAGHWQLPAAKKKAEIDLSSQPRGIYFVKVTGEKGSSTIKKLILR